MKSNGDTPAIIEVLKTQLALDNFQEEAPDYKMIQDTFKKMGDYYIREQNYKIQNDKADCSDDTEQLYRLRETAINADLSFEKINYITKQIRCCRRIDKTLDSLDSLDKELDLKDKWLGIKIKEKL